MLLSQGWTPGTNLGAVDAPHAHLHTKASSSHIRIGIKDNTLGLGAKPGSGQIAGQCTGLDVFQGLLGRLNGKSEAVLEKEQKSRDDLKRAVYVENKWGTLRFVSGGVLVGDRIRELAEGEKLRVEGGLPVSMPNRGSEEQNEKLADGDKAKAQGGEKVFKREVEVVSPKACPQVIRAEPATHENDQIMTSPVSEGTVRGENIDSKAETEVTDKAQKKAEKMQRKLDRRKRKEARRLKRIAKENDAIESAPSLITETNLSIVAPSIKTTPQEGPLIPEPTITIPIVTAAPIVGRHAVRQRYIQQKKRAIMDPKALKEVRHCKNSMPNVYSTDASTQILMIKT